MQCGWLLAAHVVYGMPCVVMLRGHYAEAKRRYTKMGHVAGEGGRAQRLLMGVVFGGSSSDGERERHT